MMTIMIPLIILLISNYVADYLFQSREIAITKSSNIRSLMTHMSILFCMMVLPTCIMFGWYNGIILITIYTLIHGVQDWFIWRGYGALVYKRTVKKLDSLGIAWVRKNKDDFPPKARQDAIDAELENFKTNKEYAEDKVFYDFIGLDSLLHVLTIILLYWWLIL